MQHSRDTRPMYARSRSHHGPLPSSPTYLPFSRSIEEYVHQSAPTEMIPTHLTADPVTRSCYKDTRTEKRKGTGTGTGAGAGAGTGTGKEPETNEVDSEEETIVITTERAGPTRTAETVTSFSHGVSIAAANLSSKVDSVTRSNVDTGSFSPLSSSPLTPVSSPLPGSHTVRHCRDKHSPNSASVNGIPSSSSLNNTSPRKKSTSERRDDIEFWASLYAQHPIYTRHATSDLPLTSSPNHRSHDHTSQSRGGRAPVKIWQVLTKTDLNPTNNCNHPQHQHQNQYPSHHRQHQHRQRASKDENTSNHHGAFQFDRLPIKTPRSSSAASAAALSSSGRPFSIVFFFTIETASSSSRIISDSKSSKSKSKSKHSTSSSASSSSPTTLWYLETAFTRTRTIHEHMELMGNFVPNGSYPVDGQDATTPPLYIYETQTLDFEQSGGMDSEVVLDLKLQSPQGVVYAEFSYSFVRDKQHNSGTRSELGMNGQQRLGETSRNRVDAVNSRSTRSQPMQGSHTTSSRPSTPLRSQLVSPNGASLQHDDIEDEDDNEDYQVEKLTTKESAIDAVVEEPDAGEHFMQATSQFFSKMGYWLYNSKVVQYIARDDRVRTKTAFPSEDIWMLGERYSFDPPKEDDTIPASPIDYEGNADDTKFSSHYTSAGTNTRISTNDGIIANPPLLRPDSTSSEQGKSPQSNSVSCFAAASTQQPTVASSPTFHENQWSYSHVRSASPGPENEEFSTTKSTSPPTERSRTPSISTVVPSSKSGSPSSIKSSMMTRFSKMGLEPGNAAMEEYDILEDDQTETYAAPQRAQSPQPEQEPLVPSARKPGRRRMTISNLFARDGNPAAASNGQVNGGAANNVSALKDLVDPVNDVSPLTPQSSSKSISKKKKKKLLAPIEGDFTAGAESHRGSPMSSTPTTPTTPKSPSATMLSSMQSHGSVGRASLVSIPEAQATDHHSVSKNYSRATTIANPHPRRQTLQGNASPSVLGHHSSDEVASLEHGQPDPSEAPVTARERKRKTSRTLVSNGVDEAAQRAHKPVSRERASTFAVPVQTFEHEHVPRTSSPLKTSLFSSKRQNSMPVASTAPKSTPQSGIASPPPPLPSSPSPPSSPGSSLRRSWRSLSLSLASTAKSALPLGLSSPIRSKSPGSALDPKHQRHRQSMHGTGLGNEYDENYSYYDLLSGSNSSLISLPPSTANYLSLMRPAPDASFYNHLTAKQEVLRQFLMDFQSRLWFTYRKDLARIEPSFYTCDSGWGCMMRTGQSLLAQAFVQVLLGREWRAHLSQTQYGQRRYTEVLNWFVDDPDRPYSIHRIAKAGLTLDKRIGEWFGPSTVAHAFKRLSQQHEDCPLSIMVPMDGLLQVSGVVQAATHVKQQHQQQQRGSFQNQTNLSPSSISSATETKNQLLLGGAWKPVLLLIPTRFGLDKLTEKYIPNLKQLFRMPQFMGIAGGRPGRSLYFVACQGDELFYYDPHFVKPRALSEELGTCPVPSFHCSVVRCVDIVELDPSMLLGFLIQSPEDLEDFMVRLKKDMDRSYPLLSVQDDMGLLGSNGVNGQIREERYPGQQTNHHHHYRRSEQNEEKKEEDTFSVKSLDSEEEEEEEFEDDFVVADEEEEEHTGLLV